MLRYLLLFILTFSCLPTNNDSLLHVHKRMDRFNTTTCLEEYQQCQITRSFFDAVCVAVTHFTINAACFAMALTNPIICGIAEGLVRTVQKPCSDYNLRCDRNCFRHTKEQSDNVDVSQMVCLLSEHVCNLKSQVTSAIDELNTNLKFRTRHNSLMMEIDYRSSLLLRYTNSIGASSGPDKSSLDLLKDMALDFDSVNGDIFSSIQLFHDEIAEHGPPYVDLSHPPSFYDVHPEPCSSGVMTSIDGTMLALFEMAELSLANSDLASEADEFREWFLEIREEQAAAYNENCGTKQSKVSTEIKENCHVCDGNWLR